MPLNRPTLSELVERIRKDLEARLSGADAFLRRNLVAILGRVYAGAVHLLYGAMAKLVEMLFPDTATGDELKRWALIWGIDPKPAQRATGTITGTGTEGTVAPVWTVFARSDGVEYESTATAEVVGGVITVPVRAVEGGTDGNLDQGATLLLSMAIPGLNSSFAVEAPGIVNGFPAETDTDLRARLLQRIQTPPQGGTEQDYIRWILSAVGVTRAWVFPRTYGAGTVSFTFAMDAKTTDPELLLDNSFAGTGAWDAGAHWSISGGAATCDGLQPSAAVLTQPVDPVVSGRTYATTFTVTAAAGGSVKIQFYPSGASGTPRSAPGTYTENVVASGADTQIRIVAAVGFAGTVDNVSVKDPTSTFVPSAQDLEDVKAHVESYQDPVTGLTLGAPVNVLLYAFRPNARALNFSIRLLGADTPEIRSAVITELENLISREALPGSILYLSRIREAVTGAAGVVDYDLVSPAANVVIATNDLCEMGTVTWL